MVDKPDWYRAALAARRIVATDEVGNGWRLVPLMAQLCVDPRYAGVWVKHTPDPELFAAFKTACALYARAPTSSDPEAAARRARRAALAVSACDQVLACARIAAPAPPASLTARMTADC